MARIGKKIFSWWEDAEGNRVKRGTPGAVKKSTESSVYYAFNLPGQPRGKAFPLKTNKAEVAERKLRAMLNRVDLGLSPLDTRAEANKLSLAEHLEDFRTALASGATGKAGKTDAQVKQVLQRVEAVIEGCKFQSLSELDGDKVADYLAKRRKLSRKDGGIGAQTSNFYLQAIRHFAQWCVIKKRLAEMPFKELKPSNVKKDRRHDRRALDLDELKKLLETTGASRKTFRGLTGRDRRFLYLIAVGTGFRRSELLGLTPHHFDLTAGLVCLSAEETKNGEAARQPLHPEVLAEVRDYLDGRQQDGILWPGT